MPSILQANALTTLATALDELGLTTDAGGVQDTRVERYINAASDFIARYCGRVFQRADAIVEKRPGFGAPQLYLARRPIVAITTVKIDGATLDASEYRIDDAAAGVLFRDIGWPWTAGRATGLVQAQVPGTEDADIEVTYNGGFVTPKQADAALFSGAARTLPSDLEDACLQLVTRRWRGQGRDPSIKAESIQSASVTYGSDAVPVDVLAALEAYRAIAHA